MSYSEPVDKLLRSGAKHLAEKNYEQAVEDYGKACGVHQEETNEIDPDLFLLYGKALYESGVSQSDVLGGQEITSEKIDEAKGDSEEGDANFQFNDLAAEEFAEQEQDEEDDEQDEEDDKDDVEQEEEEQQQQQQQQEEEDEENKTDMELAWEILEIARGVYEQTLDNHKDEASKLTVPYLKNDKDVPSNIYVKTLKSLSEVYDLLGEVSLESEHFQQAANDLEQCLEMRQKLYDNQYSGLIGESHFKLSLALEFCLDDDTAKDKARSHIKSAITILQNDTVKNPDKKQDNDDIIQSLQDRYDEIEQNAEAAINQQKQDMLDGILGSSTGSQLLSALAAPGGSSAPSSSGSHSAAPPIVNDLSSMVKKRKAKPKPTVEKRHKH